jgi:membrane protein required for colicin V production
MWTLDLVAGALALILCFMGIRRGLIEEIFRLLAVVASFFVAFFLYRQSMSIVGFLPLAFGTRAVISFIVLYLSSLIAILLLGKLVKKLLHLTPLGLVDRLAGGILGALKAALICWITVMLFSFVPKAGGTAFFSESYIYRYTKKITPSLRLPSPEGLLKESLKKASKTTPLITIEDAKRKAETFRAMVDSAKEAQKDSI